MSDQKTIFTAPVNSVYEGVKFEGGIFSTIDHKIIDKLRRSYFYGKDIHEVGVNDDGTAEVLTDTAENVEKLKKAAIADVAPEKKPRPKAKPRKKA